MCGKKTSLLLKTLFLWNRHYITTLFFLKTYNFYYFCVWFSERKSKYKKRRKWWCYFQRRKWDFLEVVVWKIFRRKLRSQSRTLSLNSTIGWVNGRSVGMMVMMLHEGMLVGWLVGCGRCWLVMNEVCLRMIFVSDFDWRIPSRFIEHSWTVFLSNHMSNN